VVAGIVEVVVDAGAVVDGGRVVVVDAGTVVELLGAVEDVGSSDPAEQPPAKTANTVSTTNSRRIGEHLDDSMVRRRGRSA
jgi:hypothetical protein